MTLLLTYAASASSSLAQVLLDLVSISVSCSFNRSFSHLIYGEYNIVKRIIYKGFLIFFTAPFAVILALFLIILAYKTGLYSCDGATDIMRSFFLCSYEKPRSSISYQSSPGNLYHQEPTQFGVSSADTTSKIKTGLSNELTRKDNF